MDRDLIFITSASFDGVSYAINSVYLFISLSMNIGILIYHLEHVSYQEINMKIHEGCQLLETKG